MVGKTGFEPATPWSQTKCSTKLSYFPYIMARPKGVEPITFGSVVRRSIQSSYGRIILNVILLSQKNTGAEDRNRTGTVVTYRRILSPVRLPVPPPRQKWSGRRDSNPRPPPWQGGVLPLN